MKFLNGGFARAYFIGAVGNDIEFSLLRLKPVLSWAPGYLDYPRWRQGAAMLPEHV
jgi:hypothetical protein